ncbi:MAG: FAD-binding oxidoreductase [Elusimicrobiota bacterium]|nr:FAD-binding oxidoreductase [Endomicrobiia bacterium]MDW8165930.1 FAD-binding oxidoreductase [Elusimicrobiota bacterium]
MKIKQNQSQIIGYLEDASNFKGGKAFSVYIPENENEVLDVLKYCVKNKIPLTISAAGTGTVAGRIPLDGVVLSTEALNKIIKIDKQNKQATLQAGVIVEEFLKEIERYNLFYPPFPTERTAFIGGNVATNASGEYSFRFGATRNYINRIKMFLTTGDILEIRRGEIFERNGFIDFGIFKVKIPSYRTPDVKCSAGYYIKDGMDAIDLIIGSEGTLGVITEVDVSLIDKLPERFIIIVFFKKDTDIPLIVKEIKNKKEQLGVYSLEFFDESSLNFLKEEYNFIPENTNALYIEAEKEKLEKLVELIETFRYVSTVVSESLSEYKKLIDFRHKLPENINSYFRKIGSIKVAVDAAVPDDKFEELFLYYQKIISENSSLKMVLFGHIGESHLHFNMFPDNEEKKQLAERIYIESIKKAVSLGGTGFAEHGIGKLKTKYLKFMYTEQQIKEMAQIKKTFDPYWILSLDNLFPKNIIESI